MSDRYFEMGISVLVIGDWNFEIIWNLGIVIWYFTGISSNTNRFNLIYINLSVARPISRHQFNRAMSGYNPDILPGPPVKRA